MTKEKKNNISMNDISFELEDGVVTHHSVIRQNNTKGLLIMLPGVNSNNDRLMMHSVSSKMLDNGYDVLNINYSGIIDEGSEIENSFDKLLELCKDVTLNQIPEYDGKKIMMFCRDIGSTVGMKLAECFSRQIDRAAIVAPVNGELSNNEDMDCKVYLDSESMMNFNENQRTELQLCPNVGNGFELSNDMGLKLNMFNDVVSDVVAYLDR